MEVKYCILCRAGLDDSLFRAPDNLCIFCSETLCKLCVSSTEPPDYQISRGRPYKDPVVKMPSRNPRNEDAKRRIEKYVKMRGRVPPLLSVGRVLSYKFLHDWVDQAVFLRILLVIKPTKTTFEDLFGHGKSSGEICSSIDSPFGLLSNYKWIMKWIFKAATNRETWNMNLEIL